MGNLKQNLNPTRDNKGRFIHQESEEVLIDPRNLRTGSQTHIYGLTIKPENLEAVPGVLSVKDDKITVTCKFRPVEDYIICSIRVDALISILDEHDLKAKPLGVHDEDDLTLSNDVDVADVLPDIRGRYDLTPSALALFYSAVPTQFSTSKLTSVAGNGYEILSEDEYEKRVADGEYAANPFQKAFGDEK